MVMMFKNNGNVIEPTSGENRFWIHVVNPSRDELCTLQDTYGIDPDILTDILDIDELSRIEKDGDQVVIILRLPIHDPEQEISYFTVPLGVIVTKDCIITVCQREVEILGSFQSSRGRVIHFSGAASFVLNLFYYSAVYFLRHLKEINRKPASIEQDLQKSVKNNELIRLLRMEKSLVFFTTALKSNELVLETIMRARAFKLGSEDADLLEDVITENRQAIEMANIYSNILSGMMDAFASVISNNLNVVMKRLTVVSLVLMIPTLVASFYGMNIGLPLQEKVWAFPVIAGGSTAFGVLVFLVFRKLRLF